MGFVLEGWEFAAMLAATGFRRSLAAGFSAGSFDGLWPTHPA